MSSSCIASTRLALEDLPTTLAAQMVTVDAPDVSRGHGRNEDRSRLGQAGAVFCGAAASPDSTS